MKKKVIAILLAACAMFGALGLAGCKKKSDGHTHSFNKQVAEDEYLESAATISDKAHYYYSCECGEKGAETFEYGTPLFTEGLKYTMNADRLGYTVTGIGIASDIDIIIPAEYKGLPVTGIGEKAFCDRDSNFKEHSVIKSITIPHSVKSIGVQAFYSCTGIELINFLFMKEEYSKIEVGNSWIPHTWTQRWELRFIDENHFYEVIS